MRIWKKIIIIIGMFCLLIAALNFSFFWKNLKFILFKPAVYPTDFTATSPATTTPNLLSIPSLGIQAPIQYVNEVSEVIFQKALAQGAVHFPGTAKPGNFGNCYIFGHSSDYLWSKGKYKTIFALLPRIEKGAEIKISDEQGNLFFYKVIDSFMAGPRDIYLLDQDGYKQKLLTLQTSYPIGTALKRWIVIAEME